MKVAWNPGPSRKLGHSGASFCSSIPRLGPVLESWFPTQWPWGFRVVMWAEGKVIKEAVEGRVNDLTNFFYFLFGPHTPRQSQPVSGKPNLHLQDELSELPKTFPVTDFFAQTHGLMQDQGSRQARQSHFLSDCQNYPHRCSLSGSGERPRDLCV